MIAIGCTVAPRHNDCIIRYTKMIMQAIKDLFSGGLHVFIVIMIFVMGIGGALITGGSFDEWGKRLKGWRRRKKKRIDYH